MLLLAHVKVDQNSNGLRIVVIKEQGTQCKPK